MYVRQQMERCARQKTLGLMVIKRQQGQSVMPGVRAGR